MNTINCRRRCRKCLLRRTQRFNGSRSELIIDSAKMISIIILRHWLRDMNNDGQHKNTIDTIALIATLIIEGE